MAIDYVPPGKRDLARETAARIRELGFIPWVSNPELDMLGVGGIGDAAQSADDPEWSRQRVRSGLYTGATLRHHVTITRICGQYQDARQSYQLISWRTLRRRSGVAGQACRQEASRWQPGGKQVASGCRWLYWERWFRRQWGGKRLGLKYSAAPIGRTLADAGEPIARFEADRRRKGSLSFRCKL
jgi:hypothetical protein